MSEIINNREHRIATLKHIIQHLHTGHAPEQVKAQLANIVRQTDAGEIMQMEQELIASGMPVEEIRSMCDLHSQVTRDVLVPGPVPLLAPGHPVDTFRRENSAIKEVIARIRSIVSQLDAQPDDFPADNLLHQWRQGANELMDIDKHYQRKEHTLFSCLERHGISGPSKVMWAKDDDIRNLLKSLEAALHQPHRTAGEWKTVARSIGAQTLSAIEEMIYKEENILLPMSLQTLTDNEWAEVWLSSPQYGWCLVEPQKGYTPPQEVSAAPVSLPANGAIQLPTGRVSVEQLAAVFSVLPLDLTFVDADDRVAFFTEGPDRVFARSRAIIGRKVQHCHPPRSVDTVERILSDFRSGRENVAEFWIDFHGKYVHIRYFAVRDEAGQYLGTVELTQDIAPLRALTGERRLLEYDAATN